MNGHFVQSFLGQVEASELGIFFDKVIVLIVLIIFSCCWTQLSRAKRWNADFGFDSGSRCCWSFDDSPRQIFQQRRFYAFVIGVVWYSDNSFEDSKASNVEAEKIVDRQTGLFILIR